MDGNPSSRFLSTGSATFAGNWTSQPATGGGSGAEAKYRRRVHVGGRDACGGLEHLKAGVGLLGITPCSCCNIYYRRSDPAALFHYGEFVCYDCVPQWWLRRCPGISGEDRRKAERELRRWLVNHHHAQVIGRSGDLPKPERLLLKLVTGCEQCEASGKTYSAGRCPHCDGRGTVWVIVLAPEFGPFSE